MDAEALESWLRAYVEAWNTNEPRDVGELFTEDAAYYTAPFREPWSGRDAIVAGWLDRKDEPGTFEFRHEVLAVTDEVGFVRGWTRYFDPPVNYSNLWIVRLDDEGRCREFIEWWMEES